MTELERDAGDLRGRAVCSGSTHSYSPGEPGPRLGTVEQARGVPRWDRRASAPPWAPLPAGPSGLLQALPRTRRKTPTLNTQFQKNTSRPRAAFFVFDEVPFLHLEFKHGLHLTTQTDTLLADKIFAYRCLSTETYIALFALKAPTPRHKKLSVYFINCSFTVSTLPANFLSAG